MSGVDLRGVDVSGCVFDRCFFLARAHVDNLRGARLCGCDLGGVALGGVDLAGAHLAGASFARATCDAPASLAGAVGLDSFAAGTTDSVRAGSLVAVDGVLVRCDGDHPSNAAYAYYRTPHTAWARATMAGCFEKRHCRVLAP